MCVQINEKEESWDQGMFLILAMLYIQLLWWDVRVTTTPTSHKLWSFFFCLSLQFHQFSGVKASKKLLTTNKKYKHSYCMNKVEEMRTLRNILDNTDMYSKRILPFVNIPFPLCHLTALGRHAYIYLYHIQLFSQTHNRE